MDMNKEQRTTTAILVIIGLILLGWLLYYGSTNWGWFDTESPPPNGDQEINFQEEGTLVRNEPGLDPNEWYLEYESQNDTPQRQRLLFDDESECKIDSSDASCSTLLSSLEDKEVSVEGIEEDDDDRTERIVRVLILKALLDRMNGDGNGDDLSDLIRVTSPTRNQTISSSPLVVNGQARGSWYFEASFPIELLDANGSVLGSGPAEAQGDWMTNNFVPFTATVNFTTPTTNTGTLVLEKANPSGLPENAQELRIPVRFDNTAGTNGAQEQVVQLYYYDPEEDTDASGNILCSRSGLVAVDREIPRTTTPIQDTIKLLIQGELTTLEEAAGITTEFPLPGFTLLSASLSNGVLTLQFADPQNQTSGGACRAGILWFQIEETAKQFPEVNEVRFIPEDLFQP